MYLSVRIFNLVLFFSMMSIILTTTALAAGSGMPWEQPLTQILESIEEIDV